MMQWLVGILSPIFEGMGVSQTDIQTYADMLEGYVNAIALIVVAAIVVMVAAHWLAKKGTRHVVRWAAGVAAVVGIAATATAAAFGPLYNNLAPIMNGGASVPQEAIDASKDVIRAIGDEGLVLLKNDGILPLEEGSNLNVFGWAPPTPSSVARVPARPTARTPWASCSRSRWRASTSMATSLPCTTSTAPTVTWAAT